VTITELSDETIERIARRTAELLRDDQGDGHLVSASEIARRTGFSRDWVYSHVDELGGVRVGDGQKPPIRFDPAVVAGRLRLDVPKSEPRSKPRRPRPRSDVPLLPIKRGGR
jgi:hypothetical protein